MSRCHLPPADIDCAVIGGGVIGLSIGAALATRGLEAVIFERNAATGQETSARSSEVIHAGIYYEPGSLKATACVAGRKSLYAFCRVHAVAHQAAGKLIVATTESEVATLTALRRSAARNGCDDLVVLGREDVKALEPQVECLGALLSPSTGIIDSHGLMLALEGQFTAHGGTLITQTELVGAGQDADGIFTLTMRSQGTLTSITARKLFVAAGLGMATLRAHLPHRPSYCAPRLHFAKGHYFELQGYPPFSHLVYPVPVPGGLGTHLTLDLQGRARFGPDVSWVTACDYRFDDADGTRKKGFVDSIRRFWPDLPGDKLVEGYTGIRPKISGPGEPAADFAVHGPQHHGIDGMAALYGIESPGLTSCLALAERAVRLAL